MLQELIQLRELVLVQHVQKGISVRDLLIKFNAAELNINRQLVNHLVQLVRREVMYLMIGALVMLVLLDTNARVMEQG